MLMTKLHRGVFLSACLFSIALLPTACSSQTEKYPMTHSELKAYPATIDGLKRTVIVLDEKSRAQEGDFKIELVAGVQQQTDGVNKVMGDYHITQHEVKGWGYPYYQVTGNGQTASTLIGVPEGTKPVNEFIAGKPILIAYNSRLPIVVYAPAGVKIKYRLWTAGGFVGGNEG